MVQDVFDWEIVGDRRCKTPRYVVYLTGQHDYHMMDWRGCNFRRAKIPNQPAFTSLKEARAWIEENFESLRNSVDGIGGMHMPENNDTFGDRVIIERRGNGPANYFVDVDGEMTQDEWENYITDTME